jgi:hypothetical protein
MHYAGCSWNMLDIEQRSSLVGRLSTIFPSFHLMVDIIGEFERLIYGFGTFRNNVKTSAHNL